MAGVPKPSGRKTGARFAGAFRRDATASRAYGAKRAAVTVVVRRVVVMTDEDDVIVEAGGEGRASWW